MMSLTLEGVVLIGALGLIVIGALGMAISNHLFRMLLALVIAESGANLLIVLSGYRVGASAPILGFSDPTTPMVDPIPQVLVLTAIVIGVGVQALAVALLLKVYRVYGTLNVRELRDRMDADVATAAGVEADASQDAPAGERPLPPVPARASGGAGGFGRRGPVTFPPHSDERRP
ncbi:sodium:proton antiporter [Thiocapsa bogorovii]|uniref:sodium:proton antiporter n=1 Tax=Thiocapsa bogorovii TaxID=521689 RepID=UPI001E64D29A|nr:NADH-quinone oxidoreductase subunit K [Thiocapsa bogorovii]UHD15944.1 NADH-quinone oxidoreductase subunit K [Thiocapsa bogorovii]